jgi:anti-sigma factor RsiW
VWNVPTATKITADLLHDYLSGGLSESERQRVERAIRDDPEITRAFEMIRTGANVLRKRLQLPTDIPVEWLAIISRWEPRDG